MKTHTIKDGDTYDKLAKHYYKDKKFWPNIQHANPSIDPKKIPIGTIIKIPDLDPNKQDSDSSTKP
ncbi:hypothetical protein NIES2107_09240 [Nostoc carneum NIES-2107]|nr:hypothetical protein NIES2107_09240 [Nostoc carneum NIES-2107]